MKILIADDHAAVRRGMRALLEFHEGWEVCGEAENGQDAIEKTKQAKPDLVILDVAMPALSGFEVAKLIKELYPETAILSYSILQSEAFLNEALRLGMDAYVSKSGGVQALVKAIEEVQHRRSLA